MMVVVLVAIGAANATIYVDWADDFVSGTTFADWSRAQSWPSTQVNHHYAAATTRWLRLGAQSRAGRFNAVERVGAQFSDEQPVCQSATVTLIRWRTGGIGQTGTSCTAYGSTLVGTAVKSVDSCATGRAPADWVYGGGGPSLDFATESSQSGWVGYRSRITSNADWPGESRSASADGCYAIYWME